MKVFVHAPKSEKAKLELLHKVASVHADAVVTKLKSLSLTKEEAKEIIDDLLKRVS